MTIEEIVERALAERFPRGGGWTTNNRLAEIEARHACYAVVKAVVEECAKTAEQLGHDYIPRTDYQLGYVAGRGDAGEEIRVLATQGPAGEKGR